MAELVTPLTEIYDALYNLGWEVGVKLQGDVYVAKGKNKRTQQDIERTGDSAELALAAVYKHAVRAYELRRSIFTKVFGVL